MNNKIVYSSLLSILLLASCVSTGTSSTSNSESSHSSYFSSNSSFDSSISSSLESSLSSTADPYYYIDTDEERDEFYANYTRATSYEDSYYRSLHHLMSGDIVLSPSSPEISEYQPAENGLLCRNTTELFSEDGNTYTVLDAYGNVAFEIYRGGAYVTLDEVAAYLYAFQDVPSNYYPEREGFDDFMELWGEYTRLNNTTFHNSGGTLPERNTCSYREVDFGSYGYYSSYMGAYGERGRITRGALRLVYVRYRSDVSDMSPSDGYVFYTYNHYSDYQEYLNYEGGWGERFGDDSYDAGGSSSYVDTSYIDLSE